MNFYPSVMNARAFPATRFSSHPALHLDQRRSATSLTGTTTRCRSRKCDEAAPSTTPASAGSPPILSPACCRTIRAIAKWRNAGYLFAIPEADATGALQLLGRRRIAPRLHQSRRPSPRWQTALTPPAAGDGHRSPTWNDNNEFEVWDGEARCSRVWPAHRHRTYLARSCRC